MYEELTGGNGARARGTYLIANRLVEMRTMFRFIHMMCHYYNCDLEREPDYCIETTMEDIENERVKAAEENRLEGLPETDYLDNHLETTAVYRKIADAFINDGIILFHGSVIAVDGQAYLFTAKSGTGKSTHTTLWRELFAERAVMVNDDKPLLEIGNEGVTVHGSPWNGKHNRGNNVSVPLKALCILERGEKNEIEKVNATDVLPMILQQTNRMSDPQKLLKTLELVETMLRIVPVYRLKCNMDIEAAKVAYEGMQNP